MAKKQIPVTLETDLIDKLNVMVDSGKYRSRSHAAEFLINKGLKQEEVDNDGKGQPEQDSGSEEE